MRTKWILAVNFTAIAVFITAMSGCQPTGTPTIVDDQPTIQTIAGEASKAIAAYQEATKVATEMLKTYNETVANPVPVIVQAAGLDTNDVVKIIEASKQPIPPELKQEAKTAYDNVKDNPIASGLAVLLPIIARWSYVSGKKSGKK